MLDFLQMSSLIIEHLLLATESPPAQPHCSRAPLPGLRARVVLCQLPPVVEWAVTSPQMGTPPGSPGEHA